MAAPLMPIILEPVLSLRYHWTFLGQTVMNTLYYKAGGTIDPLPELSDVLPLVRGTIEPEWLDCIDVGTVLNRIEARWLNRPDIASYTIADGVTAGTRAGGPCPSFVALRMYRKTGFGGKRGKGMIRIGGMSESDTLGNSPAAGITDELNLFVAALQSGVTGGVLGANVLLPALCSQHASAEAPLGFIVRGAVVLEWDYGAYLGSQNTRKVRPTV